MLSTEPGALTWLHFDNLECRQLCRLFDATEVAQMEDRLIMAIVREAAPYFVCASSSFSFPFLTWISAQFSRSVSQYHR
jgi:hypothetical protein